MKISYRSLPAEKSGIWSVLEQIQISALNFLIGIALINFSTKEEFGTYSLLFSYVLLVVGIQAAVLSVPMSMELAGDRYRDDATKISSLLKKCVWISFPLLAAILALILWGGLSNYSWALCFAFFVSLCGAALREFDRASLLLQGRLRTSFLYAVFLSFLVMALLAAFAYRKQLDASASLMVIGISGVLISFLSDRRSLKQDEPTKADINEFLSDLRGHSRWALPGVLTIWIQNNLYLTVVASLLGLAAVGDIAAARLLIMPFVTISTGLVRPLSVEWSRFQSRMTAQSPERNSDRLLRFFLVCSATFSILLFFLDGTSSAKVLRDYEHILIISAAWFVFAGLNSARSLLTAFFHGSKDFRFLFVANLISAPLAIGSVAIFADVRSIWTVPLALAFGEIVLIALLYWRKKRVQETVAKGFGRE